MSKSKTKFPQLYGDRLIVEPEEVSNLSPGGITLPESATKKLHRRGTVVAVGLGTLLPDGEHYRPLPVVENDAVLYEAFGGCDIEIEGKVYKLLRESDLVGRVL